MLKIIIFFYTTVAILNFYPRSGFIVHMALGTDTDHFPEQPKKIDTISGVNSKCNIATIPVAARRAFITEQRGMGLSKKIIFLRQVCSVLLKRNNRTSSRICMHRNFSCSSLPLVEFFNVYCYHLIYYLGL